MTVFYLYCVIVKGWYTSNFYSIAWCYREHFISSCLLKSVRVQTDRSPDIILRFLVLNFLNSLNKLCTIQDWLETVPKQMKSLIVQIVHEFNISEVKLLNPLTNSALNVASGMIVRELKLKMKVPSSCWWWNCLTHKQKTDFHSGIAAFYLVIKRIKSFLEETD